MEKEGRQSNGQLAKRGVSLTMDSGFGGLSSYERRLGEPSLSAAPCAEDSNSVQLVTI